jgi:hypothetical protein
MLEQWQIGNRYEKETFNEPPFQFTTNLMVYSIESLLT